MKGNKIASICAYVSLAISAVMMVLWCCNVGGFTVVSLDSFVGVIVALLAIVVAVASAWQIYNATDMRKMILDLKQLEVKFEEQKKTLDQEKHFSRAYIDYLYSLRTYGTGSMGDAFRFSIRALWHELQLEKPKNIDLYLDGMALAVEGMSQNIKYNARFYDQVIKINDSIRLLDNFDFIEDRYNKLFNEFLSKVIKDEEKK